MKKKEKKQQNIENIEAENKQPKASAMKKLGSAVLVLAVAANIVGLANYKTPEITQEDLTPPYVVEECIDMPPSVDELLPASDDEEKQKKDIRFSLSGIFCFIAAWLASAVSSLFPHLFAAVLTPLGVKILGWLIFAAGVIIALILALKKVFPNTPLKELLTGKRIFIILILTAVIIAVCELAAYYFKEFVLLAKLAALALGLILILLAYRKIKAKLSLT